VHVILRGGSKGTNYHAEAVQDVADQLKKARKDAWPSIMVDASHGNSLKNHNNQPKVIDAVCAQLVSDTAPQRAITGVMIESNIHAGKQDVPPEGPSGLKYGVSITDACIDWETTVGVLQRLNEASLKRRELVKATTA